MGETDKLRIPGVHVNCCALREDSTCTFISFAGCLPLLFSFRSLCAPLAFEDNSTKLPGIIELQRDLGALLPASNSALPMRWLGSISTQVEAALRGYGICQEAIDGLTKKLVKS